MAEELLNSEPELKALAEMISKRNTATNASTKLIQFLVAHAEKSVLELPETRKLMQDWIDAAKSTLQ